MPSHESTYVPALSHDRQPIAEAKIDGHQLILDLGCGTATLTLLIKTLHPDVPVIGIDGDEKILQIGRRKIEKAGLAVTLIQAMAFDLPYQNVSFDRVLSSLMFHHLTRENKVGTLKEVYRVLRSGGEFHIADFGKPQNLLMRIASYPWQLFDGASSTADHLKGLLPTMMSDCGFLGVRETAKYMTLFGTLSLYAGRKG